MRQFTKEPHFKDKISSRLTNKISHLTQRHHSPGLIVDNKQQQLCHLEHKAQSELPTTVFRAAAFTDQPQHEKLLLHIMCAAAKRGVKWVEEVGGLQTYKVVLYLLFIYIHIHTCPCAHTHTHTHTYAPEQMKDEYI